MQGVSPPAGLLSKHQLLVGNYSMFPVVSSYSMLFTPKVLYTNCRREIEVKILQISFQGLICATNRYPELVLKYHIEDGQSLFHVVKATSSA